jgi:hypothetical protein
MERVMSGYTFLALASRLQPQSSGLITADGSEQTLLLFSGLGRISGNIDLSNMQAGDTVRIRQYLQVVAGGAWRRYWMETYSGVQTDPLVYITPKESDFNVRVTLEQTAGVLRTFEYNFIKES